MALFNSPDLTDVRARSIFPPIEVCLGRFARQAHLKVAFVNIDIPSAIDRFRTELPESALVFTGKWSAQASMLLSKLQPHLICTAATSEVQTEISILCPNSKFIVVNYDPPLDKPPFHQWLRAGAVGLIGREDSADAEAIATAITIAATGRGVFISSGVISKLIQEDTKQSAFSLLPLTTAEARVAELLPTALSQKEMAAKLGVNPGTVHTHTASIFRKLQVHSRREAVQCLRNLHF